MASSSDLRIEIDPDLDAKVAHHPNSVDAAYEIAQKLAEVAKGLAPVLSGEYEGGIIAQRTKAGARVYASDFKSAWMEFGVPAHGIPGRFVLRRAADALGLSFKKSG